MEVKQIKNCGNCPFKTHTSDGMSCFHPYWKDKGAYDNLIISQDNIKMNSKPPKQCPLLKEDLVINIKYKIQ